jgi:regulator of CtrA degradation
MARPYDGSPFSSSRPDAFALGARLDSPVPGTISFIRKLAASDNFKTLFKEGMALVEDAANYLDGPGRDEAKRLRRAAAMAYASESMRLTTRLMQLASWLLLQRAVNEGDMTLAQATSEKHKVRLARQEVACAPDLFDELPPRLRALIAKSMRLQARIIHLDSSLFASQTRENLGGPGPIALHFERLRVAFAEQ